MVVISVKMSSNDDDNTMFTAEDALLSKISAIDLKYFVDPYAQIFCKKKKVRKSPLMNRGLYRAFC